MLNNHHLRVHFINVGHGDAAIIEFPDMCTDRARFGVVDLGASMATERDLATHYMHALVEARRQADPSFDYAIEFVCVTHPDLDHCGGLSYFMEAFADPKTGVEKVNAFWDCGFRTTALLYNAALRRLCADDRVIFSRMSAGMEWEYGPVRVTCLAPSIDLRNRFDTFGVRRNDASVVLMLRYRGRAVVLAGDAQFASWSKIAEEFPRRERIAFHHDALGLAERGERTDQLRCDVLKIPHHGSMHGTNLECLERLRPRVTVCTCASDYWYRTRRPSWRRMFPHQLTESMQDTCEIDACNRYRTSDHGHVIVQLRGPRQPDVRCFRASPRTAGFAARLSAELQALS